MLLPGLFVAIYTCRCLEPYTEDTGPAAPGHDSQVRIGRISC